jgi:hypothetical protein
MPGSSTNWTPRGRGGGKPEPAFQPSDSVLIGPCLATGGMACCGSRKPLTPLIMWPCSRGDGLLWGCRIIPGRGGEQPAAAHWFARAWLQCHQDRLALEEREPSGKPTQW